jgi:hypothetical protein
MKYSLITYDNVGNPIEEKQKEFDTLAEAVACVKPSKYLYKLDKSTAKNTDITWYNVITNFPEYKIQDII